LDKNLGGTDFSSFKKRTNEFSDDSKAIRRNERNSMQMEEKNYDLNDIDENDDEYFKKKRK
jgi:hypothetical protein